MHPVQKTILGAQFLFVAFGATVLVPLLIGIDPSVALFTAGLGTLIFHAVTKGKVPIFLGSSFAFIAPIIKATELYGLPGVFYKTICFQEINEVSPRFDAVHSSKRGDFYGFRNMEQLSENPFDMDFDILSRLKKNYPSKIVVASIMGQTEEEWIELAKMADIRRSLSMKLESRRSSVRNAWAAISAYMSVLQEPFLRQTGLIR